VRRVPSRPTADDAWLHGDEPVWLAAHASRLGAPGVWIAPQRREAARAAAAAGAELGILDDGFQHRRLHRDRDVVTLCGTAPFANERLLPRGPLREPPSALRRADVVVLADVDAESARSVAAIVRPFLREGAAILSWRGEPGLVSLVGPPPEAGEPIALLAGIAHPERLRGTIARLELSIADERFFRDHHRFTSADLRGLVPSEKGSGETRCVVTTEKDWPRLQPVLPAGTRVALLQQRIRWNEPDAEERWVELLRGLIPR
jgi:tetraacyldisaccharide 4'-kinase